jgi:hypothetical protein
MRIQAHLSVLARALAVFSLALIPLSAMAVKPGSGSIPAVANIFTAVYDEQTGQGCPYPTELNSTAGLGPDAIPGASFAWDFFLSPWDAVTGLSSGLYQNGTYPASVSSWLRVEFLTNNKNFAIDTRTTNKPLRKFNLDFTDPYVPAINVPKFGSTLATPGLFQVSGSQPLTSMGICSSKDCPEWKALKGTLWFDDPDPALTDVQWRVDWAFVRVLRVSSNTWYIIADACGGSQVAGLSELEGNRTRPREVNSGTFLMPMFITVSLQQ